MKNRIDVLINLLRESIMTGDGSQNCQQNINIQMLLTIEEINKILQTCERDLR